MRGGPYNLEESWCSSQSLSAGKWFWLCKKSAGLQWRCQAKGYTASLVQDKCRICAGDAQPRNADGVDYAGADVQPQSGRAAGGKKDRPRARDGCCGAACKARGRPAATGPPHPGLRAAGEVPPPDDDVFLEQGLIARHPSTPMLHSVFYVHDASFLFAQF